MHYLILNEFLYLKCSANINTNKVNDKYQHIVLQISRVVRLVRFVYMYTIREMIIQTSFFKKKSLFCFENPFLHVILCLELGQSTRHMLCCHRCNFVVEYILCEISFSECKNHLCRLLVHDLLSYDDKSNMPQ